MERNAARQLHALAVAALLGILMASASAIDIVLDPPKPQVGQTVRFKVTGIKEEDLRYSEWYRGEGIPAENLIIWYNNGDNTITNGSRIFEGVSIYSNGTMVITKVQDIMAGAYTVSVQETKQYQKTVHLTVDVPEVNPDLPSGNTTKGPNPPLGSGPIAGISIAVLAAVTAAIGVGVYLYTKSKDSGPL